MSHLFHHLLTGKIALDEGNVKIIIDNEFKKYLYSLIPKYTGIIQYGHNAHVTIIRSFENHLIYPLVNLIGSNISIYYILQPEIVGRHVIIPVISDEASLIRELCGLSMLRDNFKYFHITIGRVW